MLKIKDAGLNVIKTGAAPDGSEAPAVFYGAPVVSHPYGDVDYTQYKDGTHNRIWEQPSYLNSFSPTSAEFLEIPEGFNAVRVLVSFLFADVDNFNAHVVDDDYLMVLGLAYVPPVNEYSHICPATMLAYRSIAGQPGYTPEPYVHRSVTISGTVYREKFMHPFLVPTCGYPYVKAIMNASFMQAAASPENISQVHIKMIPCYFPYLREGH